MIGQCKLTGWMVVVMLLALLVASPVQAAQAGPPAALAFVGQDLPETPEASFASAAVNGVPLALVVFGLVAWLKKRGVQGGALLTASLCSGLIIGGGYIVTQTRPPTGDWWPVYVYWFGVLIYGLGLGLLASGVYEGGKALVASALKKLQDA